MSKVAIISGGTKGLGKELSLKFGQSGFEILALYSSDESAALALQDEFNKNDIKGKCLKIDFADFDKALLPKFAVSEITVINNACPPFCRLHPRWSVRYTW